MPYAPMQKWMIWSTPILGNHHFSDGFFSETREELIKIVEQSLFLCLFRLVLSMGIHCFGEISYRDSAQFPSVSGGPWRFALPEGTAAKDPPRRAVVFVVGGCTYEEAEKIWGVATWWIIPLSK